MECKGHLLLCQCMAAFRLNAKDLTVGEAAICMAMDMTSVLNLSPAATKSVSQLTSSSTPRREPAGMVVV